ncbi:MAG: hypothetical protein Q4P84_02010 [Elusimicrobiales bacterium]|nr:hypothetical protein [Elusimicrobiales bacterium]
MTEREERLASIRRRIKILREALEDPTLLTELTIDGVSERFDRAQAREELKELELEESRLTRPSRLYQVVLK